MAARGILAELERSGLLLAADARLPSVATRIAGAPVRGSWWAHERGRAIFAALVALEESGEATSVKLVERQVTWVHARLWPALVRVATADEPWQRARLSRAASALEADVAARGELALDDFAGEREARRRRLAAARELEERLRVHARQEHTDSGAHARVLATWPRWAAAAGVAPARESVERSKARFTEILEGWKDSAGVRGRLAWELEAPRAKRRNRPGSAS